LWKKKSINDFFISGYAVGLGFQIMEDMSFIGSDGLAEMNNLVPLVLARISQAWSTHWIYTSLFALGFYFLINKKKISTGLSLVGFVLINHFLWDSPYGEWEFVPAILGTMMILCLIYVVKNILLETLIKKDGYMKINKEII
ncbi:MAG: PrsW family glutamic-type intramembrane protease, partial [Anaerococcus sp.]